MRNNAKVLLWPQSRNIIKLTQVLIGQMFIFAIFLKETSQLSHGNTFLVSKKRAGTYLPLSEYLTCEFGLDVD